MLKIIGGEFRSRVLLGPVDWETSRPYTSRVKESVFNLLRGWCEEGARVLDLFAGVGTMGLEAISRGAAHATLVERDREISSLLRRNVASLDCADRVNVIVADALSSGLLGKLESMCEGRFDIVFIDPPYETMMREATRAKALEQIARLRPVMAEKSFIVLRSPLGVQEAEFAIEGFDGPESHDYGGGMHVMLYSPRATHDQM